MFQIMSPLLKRYKLLTQINIFLINLLEINIGGTFARTAINGSFNCFTK